MEKKRGLRQQNRNLGQEFLGVEGGELEAWGKFASWKQLRLSKNKWKETQLAQIAKQGCTVKHGNARNQGFSEQHPDESPGAGLAQPTLRCDLLPILLAIRPSPKAQLPLQIKPGTSCPPHKWYLIKSTHP